MTSKKCFLGKSLQRVTSLLIGSLLGIAVAPFSGITSDSLATAQPYAYVANNRSNTVSVINTNDNTVIATIGPIDKPISVAITPDGKFAYVPRSSQTGGVSVIDIATNTIVGAVGSGAYPGDIAITPDGAFAYVSKAGAVSVIDIATNTVVTTIFAGVHLGTVAITPDGAFAYVTNTGPGPPFNNPNVLVIDIATNTVATTIPISTEPSEIAFTPDGAFAYVTNQYSGIISVVATATHTVVDSVSVGSSGQGGIAITPDGAFAYVAVPSNSSVSVIATATKTVVATIGVPNNNPAGVAITPDGALAYVTLFGFFPAQFDSRVVVISTATNTIVATVEVGLGPSGIAITPERVTSVTDEQAIPTDYALSQNYPNPFNPSTTIRYELPTRGLVSLVIFDVLGRRVATLVSEDQPAGVYEISWNAERMSSGVYFYRLQAKGYLETKKLMLLK